MKKTLILPVILLLTLACLAAFGRIAGNDFINFDDDRYITANSRVQSGLNVSSVNWALGSVVTSNWHPLTMLSHMLDWQLFGAHASGHHLMSLFFHIGAVIFLFLFLWKTTRALWPSAFAAAFFALHPLRVESVAWASERKDVLSMFFGMASLYAYAFYAESRKRSKYVLCLLLFALSLMSKPMLVTLPFVLLLLDVWPLKRADLASPPATLLKTAGGLFREKIPFFVLTILISAVTVWAQRTGGAMVGIEDIPFLKRFFNAVIAYAVYLGKIFWPVDLAVYYPYEFMVPITKLLLSFVIILFLTIFIIHYRKKLPFLFTGWFWYLGTLIPVIGLVQVGSQAMADRYTYLPSIGTAIMTAWGIPLLFTNKKIQKVVLFPAAIIALAALASLTFNQCGYWKNSFTLFRHALTVTQNNDKMYHNLGTSYFKEGKIKEAFYHFDKAVKIRPNYISLNSRGELYAINGRYQQAIDDFTLAIKLHPDFAESYYNRGLAYDKIGAADLALEDFNKAIRLKNDFADAYNNRGIIHAKTGQHSQAIDDFSKAISLKPEDASPYANRAITYFKRGETEPGCRDARQACALRNCTALKTYQARGLCR